MKKIVLMLSVFLVVSILLAESGRAAERPAPPGFGQTNNEIVALAKKEGKVRFSASDPDEKDARKLLGPFEKKYGISVEYIRARGTESRDRVLLELMAGTVEYDLLHVSKELVSDFKKAGVLAGPFDWRTLFGTNPIYIEPEKYTVGVGSTLFIIAYNPDLVPKERIPRRWEDFLDPYWKGKFVVDTRPLTFANLYPAWGKNKLLDYCRALAANGPIWKRGQTEVIAQVAAGEYAAFCGSYISSPLRLLERDPTAKIAVSIPKEAPANLFANLSILKAAKYPNAALLLAGWLASTEGQKQWDVVYRGSPFEEGSQTARMIKDAGAKALLCGYEFPPEQVEEVCKWIVEVWGFPTPKK